jgi:hypothetical protein
LVALVIGCSPAQSQVPPNTELSQWQAAVQVLMLLMLTKSLDRK